MTRQEKQAWFILSVAAFTLAAYFVFIAFVRFDQASMAVFALSGLMGIPGLRKRQPRDSDERDLAIERRALMTSLTVFYAGFIALALIAGYWRGWESNVPIWQFFQLFWAWMLTAWGVKALATIVLYRRGLDA